MLSMKIMTKQKSERHKNIKIGIDEAKGVNVFDSNDADRSSE